VSAAVAIYDDFRETSLIGRQQRMSFGASLGISMLAALLATDATAQISPVPEIQPPDALKPFLQNGTLAAENFEWLRGHFPDAAPSDKANWTAIKVWAEAVNARERDAAAGELRALGSDATGLSLEDSYGDESVALIRGADAAASHFKSWQEFQTALRDAQPVFSGYLDATTVAESVVHKEKPAPLRDRLKSAVVGEQVLRGGLHLNDNGVPAHPLSENADRVFRVLLWSAIEKRDHANTAMMKDVLAIGGWPTVSEVGADASEAAWLLVQHADDDPAFQLQAVRMMGPLVARHEVSSTAYAYLFDRVSLKISNKQKYGTQFYCVSGHYEPRTLESLGRVDELRKAVGLGTLAEYAKMLPPHCS
jgi:hypothetical protein